MLLLLIILAPLLAGLVILALRRQHPKPKLLCPACGGAVEADFQACPHCGSALQRSCPACGAAVRTLWRACPRCGTVLKEVRDED